MSVLSILRSKANQGLRWYSRQTASVGENSHFARFYDMAVDHTGGCYAIGSAQLDGTSNTAGTQTIIVAYFSSEGRMLWARTLGRTTHTGVLLSGQIDSQGNLYAVGSVVPAGTFESRAFVCKYNRQGDLLWERYYAAEGTAVFSDLSVDAKGYTSGGVFDPDRERAPTDDVFLFGNTKAEGPGRRSGLVLRVGSGGETVWKVAVGHTLPPEINESGTSIQFRAGVLGTDGKLGAAGLYDPGLTNDPGLTLLCLFNSKDGRLMEGVQFAVDGSYTPDALSGQQPMVVNAISAYHAFAARSSPFSGGATGHAPQHSFWLTGWQTIDTDTYKSEGIVLRWDGIPPSRGQALRHSDAYSELVFNDADNAYGNGALAVIGEVLTGDPGNRAKTAILHRYELDPHPHRPNPAPDWPKRVSAGEFTEFLGGHINQRELVFCGHYEQLLPGEVNPITGEPVYDNRFLMARMPWSQVAQAGSHEGFTFQGPGIGNFTNVQTAVDWRSFDLNWNSNLKLEGTDVNGDTIIRYTTSSGTSASGYSTISFPLDGADEEQENKDSGGLLRSAGTASRSLNFHFNLSETLDTTATEVPVSRAIEADVPKEGHLVVYSDSGYQYRLHYTDWRSGPAGGETGVFVLASSQDFSAYPASAGNDVMVEFLFMITHRF